MTKEEKSAYDAVRYAANREVVKARSTANRAAHPERDKEYGRIRYVVHHAEMTAYREAHRADRVPKDRAYHAAHLEEHRLISAKRRALKYGNTPIDELLTEAQWRDILDQYHHRCAYCGKKMDKLTIDHVIPLIKGGKHSASNVVPACVHCNCTKHERTPEQWVGLAVAK